ncbi:MAG TPA: hypothetical protein VFD66_03835 [Verrucomicrobiae bacterium]|nr:hypothetical protein [Verrucomicrobiae bacterium]
MKSPPTVLCLVLFLACCNYSGAEPLITLTNLSGQVYDHVRILRTNEDGFVYSMAGTDTPRGLISFTTIPESDLGRLGISSEQVTLAADRMKTREAAKTADAQRGIADRIQRELGNEATREAQKRQAALNNIESLKSQIAELTSNIESASRELRHREAAVADYNSANRGNRLAPRLYVKKSAHVEIQDKKETLAKLKRELQRQQAEYDAQYNQPVKAKGKSRKAPKADPQTGFGTNPHPGPALPSDGRGRG